MKADFSSRCFAAAALLAVLGLGCESGGVGDPCTPEDEYHPGFSGFSVTEVNVESRSFQCETRVCLVNHFQGRVSCPYGQGEDTAQAPETSVPLTAPERCRIPGTSDEVVTVPVSPQLVARQADDAVYCSCRCNGPDPNARYCDCPSGYACVGLVEDLGLGAGQLAGSYCVKDGTVFDQTRHSSGAQCMIGNPPPCGDPNRNP